MVDVQRRLLRELLAGILAVLLAACLAAAGEAREDRYQLESVVILSRHGVRAPVAVTPLMEDLTPDRWPRWPVADGDLTPRGAHLVTLLAAYYRQLFMEQALLPPSGCPSDGAVYVWTDTAQRTRETGAAFLAGLAPGCGMTIHHQQDLHQLDPLFHPVKAGLCSLVPARAAEAVEQQAGMPVDRLDERYRENLEQMSRVLDFSRSPFCRTHGEQGKPCRFGEVLPTALEIRKDGVDISFSGALGLSSTLSEIFLLEQAQGMPEVGWGRIREPGQWLSLLALHNLQFELLERTPYIARHRGTPLLEIIAMELTPGAAGKRWGPLTLPSSILFLAGHDTNIANVGGMLGLTWTLPGQPDDTPPGGALVFERWRDRAGNTRFVRVSMIYQTLQQLRDQAALSLAAPPGSVALELPGCRDQTVQGMCPLATFLHLASRQIEPACRLLAH